MKQRSKINMGDGNSIDRHLPNTQPMDYGVDSGTDKWRTRANNKPLIIKRTKSCQK